MPPARVHYDPSAVRRNRDGGFGGQSLRFAPAAAGDRGARSLRALAQALDAARQVLVDDEGLPLFTAWDPVLLPDGSALITIRDWIRADEDLSRLLLALAGSLEAQDIGGALSRWSTQLPGCTKPVSYA